MAQLIEQKFGIKLGMTAVGGLLAKLGLTPQKPLQRAPEAIEKWQRKRYPAIARQARQQKADMFFWDESGFRAEEKITAQLSEIRNQPDLVRSFFDVSSVAYIRDC